MIETIPLDVLNEILKYVGVRELIDLGGCNKFFHQLCSTNALWESEKISGEVASCLLYLDASRFQKRVKTAKNTTCASIKEIAIQFLKSKCVYCRFVREKTFVRNFPENRCPNCVYRNQYYQLTHNEALTNYNLTPEEVKTLSRVKERSTNTFDSILELHVIGKCRDVFGTMVVGRSKFLSSRARRLGLINDKTLFEPTSTRRKKKALSHTSKPSARATKTKKTPKKVQTTTKKTKIANKDKAIIGHPLADFDCSSDEDFDPKQDMRASGDSDSESGGFFSSQSSSDSASLSSSDDDNDEGGEDEYQPRRAVELTPRLTRATSRQAVKKIRREKF